MKILLLLLLILNITFCADYQEPLVLSEFKYHNPKIDIDKLDPPPFVPIKMGAGCEKQEFIIPSITDQNKNDVLHGSWYLGKNVIKTTTIMPTGRGKGTVTIGFSEIDPIEEEKSLRFVIYDGPVGRNNATLKDVAWWFLSPDGC